jgi:hypothetical protein
VAVVVLVVVVDYYVAVIIILNGPHLILGIMDDMDDPRQSSRHDHYNFHSQLRNTMLTMACPAHKRSCFFYFLYITQSGM